MSRHPRHRANPTGPTTTRRRRWAALLVSGVVGAGVPTGPVGAVAAAPAQRPHVVESRTAGTTTGSARLAPWSPTPNDLLVVAVSAQFRPSLTAQVSGNGLDFVRVADVANVQRVQRLQVFVARGRATPGEVTVTVPPRPGAPASTESVSVVAVRVGGVQSDVTPQDVLRRVSSSGGPTRDNRTMLTRINTAPGDLVLGLGTHRNGVAETDEQPVAMNAATGTGGSRVVLSAWAATADSTVETVGAPDNLSRPTDWTLAALSIRPRPGPKGGDDPDGVPAEPGRPTPGRVPYAPSSAWNTPIPAGAAPTDRSARFIATMTQRNIPISTNPNQFAYPVHAVDATTPRRTVRLQNFFSRYTSDGASRIGYGYAPTITEIPIPAGARGSDGGDGNIILLDPSTGSEWGFHNFSANADGTYSASFGYHYNTTFAGRFPDGKAGRGSGLPYLGGLVRASEIREGRIDHALAFTYRYPSKEYVFPASRSDGLGVAGVDLPEGSRLQLNPALTEADFDRMGLNPSARVMARAMQRYGMYLVDNGGSPKVIVEDDLTAQWGSDEVGPRTLHGLPWSQFRVVS